LIKPYKADINQGTVLSRLSINQLKIGMSKKQVSSSLAFSSNSLALFSSSSFLAFSSNALALIFSCSACLAFSSARRFSSNILAPRN
jgi:hypothetical protein